MDQGIGHEHIPYRIDGQSARLVQQTGGKTRSAECALQPAAGCVALDEIVHLIDDIDSALAVDRHCHRTAGLTRRSGYRPLPHDTPVWPQDNHVPAAGVPDKDITASIYGDSTRTAELSSTGSTPLTEWCAVGW